MKYCILLLTLLFLASSCEKNEAIDLNSNVSSSNDVVLSGSVFQGIFVRLMKARSDSAVMQGQTVIIDNAMVKYDCNLKIFSFIYGYVLCPDSVVRTGIYYVNTTGDILVAGTKAIVLFDHYDEDGVQIHAIDTIETISNSTQGCLFKIKVDNGLLEKPQGFGNTTFNIKYDVNVLKETSSVVFSGNLNGVSSHGYNFSSEIKDNVIYSESCSWAVSGKITVYVSGPVSSGIIDYQESKSDSCDNTLYYILGKTKLKVRKLSKILV